MQALPLMMAVGRKEDMMEVRGAGACPLVHTNSQPDEGPASIRPLCGATQSNPPALQRLRQLSDMRQAAQRQLSSLAEQEAGIHGQCTLHQEMLASTLDAGLHTAVQQLQAHRCALGACWVA